jgi:hypothetical protein
MISYVPSVVPVAGEVGEAGVEPLLVGSAIDSVCSESLAGVSVILTVFSSARAMASLSLASSASASTVSAEGADVVSTTVSAFAASFTESGIGDLVTGSTCAGWFWGRLIAILLRKSRVLGASEASTGTPS